MESPYLEKLKNFSIAELLLEEKIRSKISIIRKIYFILPILYLIYFVSGILMGYFPDVNPKPNFIETICGIAFFGLIYFGLRFKSEWVIPAILYNSSISIVFVLINFGKPAGDLLSYFMRAGFDALAVFFFFYQIKMFTKRAVISYFGGKGKVLFS